MAHVTVVRVEKRFEIWIGGRVYESFGELRTAERVARLLRKDVARPAIESALSRRPDARK